jgi:hypothetical protein
MDDRCARMRDEGKARGQKSEIGSRNGQKFRGQRSEDGGRRIGNQRSEVGCRRSEDREHSAGHRDQRSEIRGLIPDVGGRKSEVEGRKNR